MTQAQLFSFGEMLVSLREQAESGVLDVRAEKVATRIYLQRGLPVFAQGGTLGDTLGRLLLRQGRITEEQHTDALALMRTTLAHNPQIRIGEVLVQMGLLRPEEIFEALRAQTREKILACFQWDDFESEFHEGEAHLEHVVIAERIALDPLLLEGIKRYFDPTRLEGVIGPLLDGALALREDGSQIAQRFAMNGREQRFVLELASQSGVSLRSLVEGSTLDAVHARQIVVTLLFAGLAARAAVRPSAPRGVAAVPTPARGGPAMEKMPARGVPPIEKTPAPPPARPAFRAQAPGAPPSRPAAAGPTTGPKPADKKAATSQSPPAPPPPKDERQAKLQADEAFQLGRRLYRESHLGAAQREFKKAVALQPNEPEYQLYEAWLDCLTTKDPKQQPGTRAHVREAAARMLKQNRMHAMSHHVLGQVWKLEGQSDKAIHHFQLAIDFDPSDFDSERELRVLRMREPKTKRKTDEKKSQAD